MGRYKSIYKKNKSAVSDFDFKMCKMEYASP